MPDRDTASPPARLPRAARLKRRSLIRALFDRRAHDVSSIAEGCVRVVYRKIPRLELGVDVPVQVAFAPGRSPHGAVGRNRVKRILREVYREHQQILVDLFLHTDRSLTAILLFRGAAAGAAENIRTDLPVLLQRLARRLGAPVSPPGL